VHRRWLCSAALVPCIDLVKISGAGTILGLLLQLELEEGLIILLALSYHMLFQKEVIGGREVVVLVVLDRTEEALAVEVVLRLQVANDLLVQQVEALRHGVLLVVLQDEIWPRALHGGWTNKEARGLWPVELIPRMLTNLLDIYSLVWICDEYPLYHAFGLL